MKRTPVLLTLLAITVSTAAQAQWIPTNTGNGADAEVRESIPSQNRGDSTELATRILDTTPTSTMDRNGLFYMRFDLSSVATPPLFETALRLTYRQENLTEARIQDSITPDPSVRTGITVYGLDPAAAGVGWGELTINYSNAPGLTPDGDVGTRDLNGDLIFLGSVMFPEIGTQNHLPVGGALIFESPLLDQFVADVLSSGSTELTLMAHTIHDGMSPFSSWLNFNYIFNPKEQVTIRDDLTYDSDINDPGNPLGSPWSGADNSTGEFSPSLLIQEVVVVQNEIPVLSTTGLVLLALLVAGIGLVLLRRRAI